MANLVQGEWGGMPAEQGSVIAAERKRRLAEALKRESTTPQGQMVGRVYVAPSITQYLASGLKGYQANKMQREADTAEENVYKERAAKVQAANQALAEALKPKQVQDGETVSMPAYTPEQMDQFGSPRSDVQRQEVRTPTYKTVAPTAQDQQLALMQYYAAMGDPRGMASLATSTMNRALDREDKQDERAYGEQREEKIYNRNRTDKLTDIEADREFQRIMTKDQQGFQLSMQERNFANQWKMQQSNQSFQAGQNDLSRQNSAAIAESKINAANSIANPKLTEAQGKANLYQSRAGEADKIINDLEGKYSPLAVNAKQGAGNLWLVGGGAEAIANKLLPENEQKAEQAQRNFINAILRQESGAVISDQEFDNAKKQYFPQPGDSQGVIDQKRKNRQTAIQGLQTMSGPAYQQPDPNQAAAFRILGVEE